MKKKNDITVLILTFNEEKNLPFALENVKQFCSDIVVLDSYSTDRTISIAKSFGARVFQRKFDNFSNQRKYALEELDLNTEWVFVLDADELITDELKSEILETIEHTVQDAFFIKRRFYWKNKWIKRGYYPIWLLRFGRVGTLTCDNRPINEHLICKTGKVDKFKHDFIDFNRRGLGDWLAKHNIYSESEALQLYNKETAENKISFFKSQYERKRWIRYKVWNKLPPILRPFVLFFFRYVIMGGIFDGKTAFQYHFLHSFFYRYFIELKFQELKENKKIEENE